MVVVFNVDYCLLFDDRWGCRNVTGSGKGSISRYEERKAGNGGKYETAPPRIEIVNARVQFIDELVEVEAVTGGNELRMGGEVAVDVLHIAFHLPQKNFAEARTTTRTDLDDKQQERE